MNLEEKVVEYLEAFEGALQEFGPQVAEFGLLYVRVDSAVDAIGGLALLIVALLAAWRLVKLGASIERNSFGEPEGPHAATKMMVVVLGGLATFVLGMFGVGFGLNAWNWIGMFAPELKLVHEALLKL